MLRLAFVGKGGSGKSAIVGTLARVLAVRGDDVLVLDSDTMPGLALSLGMEPTDAGIPDEATREGPEDGPRFELRHPPLETVERHAMVGPDGVRLIQLGKLWGHSSALVRSQFAFRQIVTALAQPDAEPPWHLIGDLPGGTRQPYFGWGGYASQVLVVVEPSAKSVLSARRLARLSDAEDAPEVVAVANKVRPDDDVAGIGDRVGLEVVAAVPWDETLAEAERLGRAPIDRAPDSPAVRVIRGLADRLAPTGSPAR